MKKEFDCVDMKRKGAERVLERIRGMTPAEELEYWRRVACLLPPGVIL